jgi:hypothetical protein
MADIKELGESLLARAKANSRAQYKKSRDDGYKIAALTAGVGLMNQAVKQHAIDFMGSEQVMAQKAKYRATVNRADNISKMNEAIQATGKTPEQFFMDTRYLPAMEEQYKSEFGAQFVPESYKPQLRAKAMELAAKDAEEFRTAYELAAGIPDMETAMADFNTVVMPPTNIGGSLVEKVKGFFTGKKEEDFRSQAIKEVSEQGLLKNDSYKVAFDRIANNEGLDEATRFVRSLDTSGFKENVDVKYDVEIMSSDQGGQFSVFTTETVNDPTTGKPVRPPKVTRKVFDGFKNPDAVKDLESAYVTSLDLGDKIRAGLNPDGQAAVAKEAEARNIAIDAPTSVAQAQELAQLYTEALQNPSWIKDDVTKQTQSTILAAIIEANAKLLESDAVDAENNQVPRVQSLSDAIKTVGEANRTAFGNESLPVQPSTFSTPKSAPVDWNDL